MKFNRRDFLLYSWPRHNMVASHKYVHSIVQIDNQFFVLIIKRPSVCLVPNESMKKLSTQTAARFSHLLFLPDFTIILVLLSHCPRNRTILW